MYIRNKKYENPPSGTIPTKLVASAIFVDGFVWTGSRHYQLIHQCAEDTGKRTRVDQQGFWTDDNRYVTRPAGLAIALKNNQIKRDEMIAKNTLTSEDLW